MCKKIAITGGIGSGKSTVLTLLKNLGYPVFSCDEIYLEITQSQAYVREMGKLFPACIVDGKIDRAALADIVFKDEQKRRQLNNLAHPIIMKTLLERMNQEKGFSFAEVPLLWEGNYQDLFDCIFVIIREKSARMNAVIQRDKTTAKNVEARIAAQVNYDDADFFKKYNSSKVRFIENNASLQNLEREIKIILNSIK